MALCFEDFFTPELSCVAKSDMEDSSCSSAQKHQDQDSQPFGAVSFKIEMHYTAGSDGVMFPPKWTASSAKSASYCM